MQTLGTMLLVLFAFAIVHLSGAANRFAGWATFFGAMLAAVLPRAFGYVALLIGTAFAVLGVVALCGQAA